MDLIGTLVKDRMMKERVSVFCRNHAESRPLPDDLIMPDMGAAA
jgi:hypothetical protein